MSAIGHILSTLAKAIVRVLLTAVIGFVIGFAVVIGAIFTRHAPGTFDYIGAVLVGLLVAYASGLTVLMIAAVTAAFDAARGAVQDAGAAIGDVEKGVGALEHKR
ncbi:MAG TPA: hypothetical protein VMV29_24915 [Ktedonobacterales bacterium]|nr:hypothetical protein [Ktedonobacterales bacterium]